MATIQIRRGDQHSVTIALLPRIEADPPKEQTLDPGKPVPKPAVGPLTPSEATEIQQAWADYLGVPVERTIDLPGGVPLTVVLIPPGEFTMGTDCTRLLDLIERAHRSGNEIWMKQILAECQRHRVRITKPFWDGKIRNHSRASSQHFATTLGTSLKAKAVPTVGLILLMESGYETKGMFGMESCVFLSLMSIQPSR